MDGEEERDEEERRGLREVEMKISQLHDWPFT